MKISRTHSRKGATLLELIVVLAVIGAAAILLLPVLARPKHNSCKIYCVNNLKQVGVAFELFSQEHFKQFPMQVSTNEGGMRELVEFTGVVPHLRLLSNELNTPNTLLCPTEQKRTCATNFESDLTPNKISYFVGIDVTETNTEAFLSGDRNITNAKPGSNGIFSVTTNTPLRWTEELHNGSGNILFVDGHVEGLTSALLRNAVRVTGLSTNRLAMP
jgi:prepilin-type processing-associated H-X9-DG protein